MITTIVEVQKNNVTVSEFFDCIKTQCDKKELFFTIQREKFENPENEYSRGYTVIDGKQKWSFSDYQMVTKYRPQQKNKVMQDGIIHYCVTNEFEEYQEKELCTYGYEDDATDTACVSEITRVFAYDCQTYILNFDGTCYNEICNFSFDTGNLGHGYYYQIKQMQED